MNKFTHTHTIVDGLGCTYKVMEFEGGYYTKPEWDAYDSCDWTRSPETGAILFQGSHIHPGNRSAIIVNR